MEKYMENFRNFNTFYEEYLNVKSEDNINGLNKHLTLISTILDPRCFDPLRNKEICSFFINLHNLIAMIDGQSSLLWSSIAALEQAINSGFHKTLVENLKFLSVLSKILQEVTGKAKLLKLLNILHKLTLNVKLTWNEPFLDKMMKSLVSLIQRNEDEIVHLATLVLINLCFKNVPAIENFRENFDYEDVLEKVQKHALLKFKLEYILFEPSEEKKFEINSNRFMKNVFLEVKETISYWNLDVLCHTIDFFIDIKENYLQYFDDYTDGENEVSNLIMILDEKLKKEEKIGDGNALTEIQEKFLAKIMELFRHFTPFLMKDDHLRCMQVLNFSLEWIWNDKVAIESFKFIQEMLQISKICDEEKISATIVHKLPEILLIVYKIKPYCESISALCKFLIGLLTIEKFEKVVLSILNEEFFQQIFRKLTNYRESDINSFTKTELEMYIYGLKLLQIVSHSNKEGQKLKKLFQKTLDFEITQNILGQSLFLQEVEIVKYTLEILRECPLEIVTNTICEKTSSSVENSSFLVKTSQHRVFVKEKISHHLQERIEKSIEKILEARCADEFTNKLNLNEVIDLFEFKVSMTNNNELFLLKRLDDAGREITFLSHENLFLKAQKVELKDKIEELKESRMREMQAGLKAVVECQKISEELNNIKNALMEKETIIQDLKNKISVKHEEISNLTSDYQKITKSLNDKERELEILKEKVTENEN